jgi:hypothetical protein
MAQPETKATVNLSDDTIAELRKLRAEMHAIRTASNARTMHYGWLKHVVKDLETNPHTQYKVHYYGMLYWLVNFPLVAALFFLAPGVWLKWGIFITLVYSIYANFATDYGSMSSAMAAFGNDPLPELPSSAHVEAKRDGQPEVP